MKYGITSEANPEARYSKAFYNALDIHMEIITTFESRLPARVLEVGLCVKYTVTNGKLPALSSRC